MRLALALSIVTTSAGLFGAAARAQGRTVEVTDGGDIGAAVRAARPGDEIRVRRGTYGPLAIWGIRGTEEQPIRIVSVDGIAAAVLEGGSETLRIGNASAHVAIEGFEIRRSGDNLIHIDGGSHHIALRQLLAHHAGTDGDVIKVNQATHILIDAVDVSFPGRRSNSTDNPYQECIDLLDADHSVVRRSHIHDGGNMLVYVKGGSRSVRFEENVIATTTESAQEPCVGLGAWSDRELLQGELFEAIDVTFVNNVVAGCRAGALGLYDVSGAYIAHNAFVDNDRVVIEVRAGNGPASRSENVEITANLFLDTRGRMPSLYMRQAGRQVVRLDVHHNAYWNAGGPVLRAGDLFDIATETGIVRADPRVRGGTPQARNRRGLLETVRPRAGSPLLDAARAGRVTRDAVGCSRPVGAAPDIGPFEIDGAAPGVPAP
ncbi:MAG: right-handed parallel beta-helix repeat-containing protein [Deltaproteobacteria bacterium]|nr:right-handed parallel beta-helix repeat-containing protein [Deltaproteobacteria bacterium]